MLVSNHLTDVKETLFKCYLQAHQSLLECQPLLSGELRRDNHGSTLHDERGSLWNNQDFVTELSQVLLDSSESCRLSSTRSSRKQDSRHVDLIVVNIIGTRSVDLRSNWI